LDLVSQTTDLELSKSADMIVATYDNFLGVVGQPKAELFEAFSNPSVEREYMEKSREFGQAVFAALEAVGRDNKLYRIVVV
jgi:hypothetical protein